MTSARDPVSNRIWPFFGGSVRDLGINGSFVVEPLLPAKDDEVVARIDAVSICSSDVKIIRLGPKHPLVSKRDLAADPIILGHEVALTVVDVGRQWADRYRPGQRLGLQPAVMKDGKRVITVGFDVPGGFEQYLRLEGTVLGGEAPHVFDVPEGVSAATIALLEPYACVEAAFRKNSRTTLKRGGRLLVMGGPDTDSCTLDADVDVAEAVLVNAPPALHDWARRHAAKIIERTALPEGDTFDDIIACGNHSSPVIAAMLDRLNRGGLFAWIAANPDCSSLPIDAARIHYHEIALVGARGPHVDEAFGDARNRFDMKPGGVALILGAGGAMGRIHVHRALELRNGPSTIIATSRQGERLDRLTSDFAPLARALGKKLVVVEDGKRDAALATHAPDGVDDAVVVAPDTAAIERAAKRLAPGALLVVFAGTPFGEACHVPLGRIAADGLRITGSTGCTVGDQIGVLNRVLSGELDPASNIEAVAGMKAVPDALAAVAEGQLHGKVVIYPALLDLPLTPLAQIRNGEASGWTREDEKQIGAA